MKTKLKLNIGIAILAIITTINFNASAATFHYELRDYIVPAPTSPNYDTAVQNAFAHGETGFVTGYIPVNNTSNGVPNIYEPPIWRFSETMWGPSSFNFWDGVPTTNSESGSWLLRLAVITCDEGESFLLNEIYFENSSTEFANSMGYTGNCATNTADGTPLAFGPNLRGRYAYNGVTNSFVAGQSQTNRLTKAILGIRVGWKVNNSGQIASNFNYAKGLLQFATVIKYFTKDASNNITSSGTRALSSHWKWGNPSWNGSNATVPVAGQRRMNMLYHLIGTTNLVPELADWHEVGTGGDGNIVDTDPVYPMRFYYVTESAPVSKSAFVGPVTAPTVVGSNAL
jgi:hypothetical protein